MRVYCISGLGADSRVFGRLKLNAALIHIHWLAPQQHECLQQYVLRLSAQIDATQPFALLGVSFGGVVARELARLLNPSKVIILSSFAEGLTLPTARFSKLAPLLQRLPPTLLKPPCWLMAPLFGATLPAHKKLMCQILKDTDPDFLRWALLELLDPPALARVSRLIHIHGDSDRLIRCPQDKTVIRIKGAGHFMVYTHAAELSPILNKLLGAVAP